MPLWLVLLLLGGVAGALAPAPAHAFYPNARHAGAYDVASGTWLYEKSLDRPAPVASLTKIAAALTFRRLNGDLDQLVTIRRGDWKGAGKTRLRVGDRVPARTLLRLSLVASDNCAARALCHPFGLSYAAFGYRMQETSWRLGCRTTRFVEPTGLSADNLATGRDVVRLFLAALEDPVLREFLETEEFQLPTHRGSRTIVHSSRLLRYRREVTAAKTGYTSKAGYCLVQWVEDPRGPLVTVIMGAPHKRTRMRESVRLADFARRQRARARAGS